LTTTPLFGREYTFWIYAQTTATGDDFDCFLLLPCGGFKVFTVSSRSLNGSISRLRRAWSRKHFDIRTRACSASSREKSSLHCNLKTRISLYIHPGRFDLLDSRLQSVRLSPRQRPATTISSGRNQRCLLQICRTLPLYAKLSM
jgi:hypothetical protein